MPLAVRLSSCLALLMLATAGLQAQIPVRPRWYRTASGLLGQPAAGVSAREIERLGRYLTFGVPYCGALTPADYAVNRELAGRMGPYLASVRAGAADLEARVAAVRLATAFSYFPCAFPDRELPIDPPPPPEPGAAPFSLTAPDLGRVPDDQQETAADLLIRYESDARRSASAWRSAETLRLNLASGGLGLNAQTASAMTRLQPLYESATAALKQHNWTDALSALQAAEATTQKIASVAGR